MRKIKIYLSGAMGGLSVEEQMIWRTKIRNMIRNDGFGNRVIFHSPPEYFPWTEKIEDSERKSEKEVMEYDLYQVRTSDLIIVNFNKPDSIGTAMELMLAKELHIPIIGLNEDNLPLHSWLVECCNRMCSTKKELVDYVERFYLYEDSK